MFRHCPLIWQMCTAADASFFFSFFKLYHNTLHLHLHFTKCVCEHVLACGTEKWKKETNLSSSQNPKHDHFEDRSSVCRSAWNRLTSLRQADAELSFKGNDGASSSGKTSHQLFTLWKSGQETRQAWSQRIPWPNLNTNWEIRFLALKRLITLHIWIYIRMYCMFMCALLNWNFHWN